MGGTPCNRKSGNSSKKRQYAKYKLSTRYRAKDIDQIHEDMKKKGIKPGSSSSSSDVVVVEEDMKSQEDIELEEAKKVTTTTTTAAATYDPDLPGGGLYYCHETGRHFMSQDALDQHRRGKAYKKRVKELLKGDPYSQSEAEAAAGMTKEAPSGKRARIMT